MEESLERFAATSFERSSDIAHDLKTPLNIAILNLELLRMRVRKVTGSGDEKIDGYARAIDGELRRLARVFDAFFVYSVPPKTGEEIGPVDVAAELRLAAEKSAIPLPFSDTPVFVTGYRSRVHDLVRNLFDGVAKNFSRDSLVLQMETRPGEGAIRFRGTLANDQIEFEKFFKFYYTDPSGNPELSLATARLIAETLGGTVTVSHDEQYTTLEWMFPLGER